jgi:hypothetical protein
VRTQTFAPIGPRLRSLRSHCLVPYSSIA